MHNFSVGDLDPEEDPKTSNGNLFISDLVHFLIIIVIRGRVVHFRIFPIEPSYNIHI